MFNAIGKPYIEGAFMTKHGDTYYLQYACPGTQYNTYADGVYTLSLIHILLKHNKPLQCYIASNASDKLAQQVGSQAIINTMLNGILIGNMGLARCV